MSTGLHRPGLVGVGCSLLRLQSALWPQFPHLLGLPQGNPLSQALFLGGGRLGYQGVGSSA